MHFYNWCTHASFEKKKVRILIKFDSYHERERKTEENANSVYNVHLLAKLCNIFDEAFLLKSVYKIGSPFLRMLHKKFGFDWHSGFVLVVISFFQTSFCV